jgi:hypothetical protein
MASSSHQRYRWTAHGALRIRNVDTLRCRAIGLGLVPRGPDHHNVSDRVYNRAVPASGVPSARKKLDRARFHLETLRGEVDAFRAHSPYEFSMESPGNKRWEADIRVTVTVTKAPPIPDSWGLITGDILTNVRAALDHAVFPHIRAKKPDLDRKFIQYPIEDRKEQWENKNRWFEKPVHKVVGESQPCRHADPTGHPLRVLRELVNMDKHRDLVIANYSVDDFVVPPQDLYQVVSTTVYITEMVPGTWPYQAVRSIDRHGPDREPYRSATR